MGCCKWQEVHVRWSRVTRVSEGRGKFPLAREKTSPSGRVDIHRQLINPPLFEGRVLVTRFD